MKTVRNIIGMSLLTSALLWAGDCNLQANPLDLDSLKGQSIFYGENASRPDSLNSAELTAPEAAEAAEVLFKEYQKELKKNFGPEWGKKVLLKGDLKMPFDIRLFGEKPEDGRSLYISMHGGGNAPKQLNDSQWVNQISLYTPEEGVYIAPRAPFDDWNMWFRPEMDFFFDRLIQLAVIELDVNPNKVYLMGYSAGGDGVYRMAPRMADRWAAASMMAGHPGDVSPLNLRNIGFSFWCGANDSAYDRNKMTESFEKKLAELKENDPDGYTYEMHLQKGKGHWMDREDAAAIPWMAKFRRNFLPEKVAWRQEEADAMPLQFYWLAIPKEQARKGATVIAKRGSNIITLEKCDYSELYILLNDVMVDLNKPVTVLYNGKELFNGKVKRTLENIYDSIRDRGDQDSIFSGKIKVEIK